MLVPAMIKQRKIETKKMKRNEKRERARYGQVAEEELLFAIGSDSAALEISLEIPSDVPRLAWLANSGARSCDL